MSITPLDSIRRAIARRNGVADPAIASSGTANAQGGRIENGLFPASHTAEELARIQELSQRNAGGPDSSQATRRRRERDRQPGPIHRMVNAWWNRLLGAVYGGVINGAGYGLIYTTGTTGGGTDILAKILRRRYPYINFGTLLFGMNVLVVLTFAFLFKKYDSCMYTMIEMFISSKVVNLVLYGPGVSEVCYIISSNVGAIKSAITCTMGRGVTLLNGEGAWSGREMQVILCLVQRPEIAQLREVVRSVDGKAFVIVSEAKDVFGRGFGNIYGDD